jgi:serine/threonine-protein kinase
LRKLPNYSARNIFERNVQTSVQKGTTNTFRIKALLLHIDQRFGRAQGDAFLLSMKLDREYLKDEMRPLSVHVWHHALQKFASRWGRGEIAKVVSSLVHPENLGAWARLLRGADNPLMAYRRLETHAVEDFVTERWSTLAQGKHSWTGQVLVSTAIAEERDGLCALARAAELACIPLLFGLKKAQVRFTIQQGQRGNSIEQRFRVRWRQASWSSYAVATVGLAIAAGVFGMLRSQSTSGHDGLLFSIAGAIVGVIASTGWIAASTYRARTTAQLVRLRALERSVSLREARERHDSGFHEGVVIAGQYQLTEKLGVGASGTIWEANRLADGFPVAIKLLRAAIAHDTVAADRLRREAAALGLAWHPNVVEVYDDGHLSDGTSFLVMERLYGESLAMRLKRVGIINPAKLLPIAMQVCDALEAVHAAGIVHRDLKPSNIYLAILRDPNDVTGEILPNSMEVRDERVKLLDFGIARVEWAETRLTNAGAPLGTPGYMSPEQEQGLEIDARSDLFALGSILFECLAGRPPPMTSAEFRSEPLGLAADSAVQVAFRTIPENWRRVIETATDPLPRNRYPDARALREALSRMASGTDNGVHRVS